jgi:DNA-damage-inducible protein J
MATNALVSARIDRKVKADAETVLKAMGLNVSSAMRLLLTRVAAEGALPFEPLVPNAETIAAMKEARAGGLASFSTVDDLMADLNADD